MRKSTNSENIFLFSFLYSNLFFSLFAPETLGMPELEPSKTININAKNEIQNLQCSFLIVDPVRRKEIWRFVTYMFLHANHQHIGYNLLMQLLIGE